jgi:DNA-binding Lrp family transcriptional regulator
MIFLAFIDIKPGLDELAYSAFESLGPEKGVTPLLIGRVFEEFDILLLIHTEEMEELDDYLIQNVRSSEAAEELIVVPIYEFTLLPSFDSIVELEAGNTSEIVAGEPDTSLESDELLLFMAKIDVEQGMDRTVMDAVTYLQAGDAVTPLMAGHTFHSQDFDLVLFFLARDLDSAWEFGKRIRVIKGVRDTSTNLIAHFEAMVPLEKFRDIVRGSGKR